MSAVRARGALACLLVAAVGAGAGCGGGSDESAKRPNVVVVMTDDQDVASMSAMDNVRSLLAERGVTFANNFVSYPLCCPSRASFLTGRYAHNHGVLLADTDPSRSEWRQKASRLTSSTLPIWLQGAGYRTALVGKYMNGYGIYDRREIPPGWDDWVSPVGERSIYGYYDFTLNEDGKLRSYSGKRDYQTNVLTAKAVDFIDAQAGQDPFFLYLAYVAPHIGFGGSSRCEGSARPAPGDLGALAAEQLPMPPSFDEADVSDKPSYIQHLPLLRAERIDQLATNHECRLESLLAVDRGVATIVDALDAAGELEDTVIVFTSDNGWMDGQHRLTESKFFPYEESLRVPLIIAGAGGDAGGTVDAAALNIDLAPTILALAGASPDRPVDGVSLLPAIDGDSLPSRNLLFEGYYNNAHTGGRTLRYYTAIRDGDLQYTRYRTGEQELYDLSSDPYELDNLAGDPSQQATVERLSSSLKTLQTCAGTTSDPVEGHPPCAE